MSTVTQIRPEDLLTAAMYKVGPRARIVDDNALAEVFNAAADRNADVFGRFRWHPNYHVSDLLSETLQILDHAGIITRENAAQKYFRASSRAAGAYGKSKYEALSDDAKSAVDWVAARIGSISTDR